MTIKCKVRCAGLQDVGEDAKRGWFSVVEDPRLSPEERFGALSAGMLEVLIDNPKAIPTLKVGAVYYLYLTSNIASGD